MRRLRKRLMSAAMSSLSATVLAFAVMLPAAISASAQSSFEAEVEDAAKARRLGGRSCRSVAKRHMRCPAGLIENAHGSRRSFGRC